MTTPLREANDRMAAEIARLEAQLDEVAIKSRIEGERRFWRAAYEELLDKVIASLK